MRPESETDGTPRYEEPQSIGVSTVIPVFNGERYLRETIAGVFRQTRPPREVLFIDDGSTDGSDEIIAAEIARAPRSITCRRLRNRHHLGIGGTFNRGILESRAGYVHILPQDDLIVPTFYERQLAAFLRHPAAGLVFSDARVIDDAGRIVREKWGTDFPPGIVKSLDFIVKMSRSNCICTPATMVPRHIYERVGLFDTRFKWTLDYEMWTRIGLTCDVVFIDEALASHRSHAAQETQRYLTRAGALRGAYEMRFCQVAAHHRFPEGVPIKLRCKRICDAFDKIKNHWREDPLLALWGLRILADGGRETWRSLFRKDWVTLPDNTMKPGPRSRNHIG